MIFLLFLVFLSSASAQQGLGKDAEPAANTCTNMMIECWSATKATVHGYGHCTQDDIKRICAPIKAKHICLGTGVCRGAQDDLED